MAKSLIRFRIQAFHRQNGRCFHCGVVMCAGDPKQFANRHRLSDGVAKGLRCTAEHLLARQDGGLDTSQNIAAACWLCNCRRHKRKNVLVPEKYREIVRSRISQRRWHASQVFHRALL